MSKRRSAMSVSALLLRFTALCIGALLSCPSARAADVYWDSTGTDWGATASWSTFYGSGTPNPSAVPGINETANFSTTDINTAQTVNLGSANRSAVALLFAAEHTTTTAIQAGGTNRTLTLAGSFGYGISMGPGTGAVTIGSTTSGQQVSLILNASQNFTNVSSSSLTIFNGITTKPSGGGGPFTLTAFGNGSGAIIFNGALTNAAQVLAVNINRSTFGGTGVTTLAGANTFTGGVTLTSGTLNINSTTALGASTSTFNITAGIIDNTTAGAIVLANNNPQTWGGDFTFTGTQSLNLGTGAVALAATRQVTVSANTLTAGGVISGAGGLTKTGAGTLALTGANSFTGATTINGGILSAGSNSALNGTASVTVNSGGTLLLAGTANTTRVKNTAPVALNSGGKITFGATADAANTSETLGAVTLAGDSTLDFASSSATTGFVATFSSLTSLPASGVVTIVNWNGTVQTAGVTGTNDRLIFTANSLGLVNGSTTSTIVFDIGGTLYSSEFLSVAGGLELVPFTPVPVPEPATVLGGCLALVGTCCHQRRRLQSLACRLIRRRKSRVRF